MGLARPALARVRLGYGRSGASAGRCATRKYVSLCNVSRATAFRELSQLVELGCLAPNDKSGRSAADDIAWSAL